MLLASFADEEALRRAAERFGREKVGEIETYSPAPVFEDTSSPIPLIIMAVGVLSAVGIFLLQAYAYTLAYPIDIGGRPDLAWPSFIPMAFEGGVLFAIGAGVGAFFFLNGMPCLYDPVDEADMFREASRDGWLLAVRAGVGAGDRARALLAELRPEQVEEIAE